MIEEEELVVGQWYDGFAFYGGKQRGVLPMRWTGHSFQSAQGAVLHYKDPTTIRQAEFEPNVLTVKTEEK